MLSRLDKNTQLPLATPEEDIKAEKINKEADIQKKRLTVIIILSTTIGLCLLFWAYRSFKTNPPKLEIPTFKSVQSGGSIVPNSELKKFISNNKSINSFYLKVTNPDSEYFYGQSPSNIPSLENVVSRLTIPSDSPIPEGLVYKEIITPTEIIVSLTVHSRNFIVYINSPDSQSLKSNLIRIISLSYWSVFGN